MPVQHFFATLFAAVLLAFSTAVSASGNSDDPRRVIEEAVTRMTDRLVEQRDELNQDASKVRALVNEELDTLVDFRRITRMVMGSYFSQARNDQRVRFMEVFRTSLVNTYASGVTLYDGQEVTVLPLRDADRRGDYARVRMQFNTDSGQQVPIHYTLFQRDNQWRVINVHVSGLDLGDTFRRQFAQAMNANGDDIDAVIASWSASDAGLDEAAEQFKNEL